MTCDDRGKDAKATFDDILYKQVRSVGFFKHPLCGDQGMPWPKVSSAAKDLIGKLLAKDEKKRLGYEQGVAQIKAHAWFKDVKWDLQRNQEPPVMPPAKNVEIRTERQLEPLEKIFEQLDKEEVKKIEEAAKKRAAKRAEKGEEGGTGSPEVDRSGANNPQRLKGFRYVEQQPVEGTPSASGAYGDDQTGRKKLIQGMAVEAQRRADAQRFTLELALPLPAAAAVEEDPLGQDEEEEEEATGRVTIGGLVFESVVSAVVVDAVSGSAAAEEPRLRAAAGGAVLLRVNEGVVDGKSCQGSLERALASTTRNTVELHFDAGIADSGGGSQKKVPMGGDGVVDSRTSIAWNSHEEDAAAAAAASGSSLGGGGDEAGEMMLEAAVPEGASPGTVILVLAPTGQRVEVTVPEGAEPGSLLRVVVPAAAVPATPREADVGPPAAAADSGDPVEEFASALAALQAGEYASAVAHFEAVLTLDESEGGPRHDEARSGLEQAQRGVTLSGLGSEQLQQMLEEDGNGMHQHLGLAEADEAEGTEGDGGSTASSRDSGAPQSPAPAGLRSWLPKGRKSSRKTDEVY